MLRYIMRRLALMIPMLGIISMVAFVLVRMAPGGPFDRERAAASPEIERALRAKYHLDEPLWKQYGRYVWGLVHGDLGPSLKYRNHTVNDIVAQALPVSLSLGLLAFGLAQGLGIPMGFLTAARRGRWEDWVGTFLVLVAVCVLGFVMGPLLVMVLALKWEWLPAGLWESARHAVLPVAALGLFFAGRVARLMREGMLGTMQSEFITAARAKGLSEGAILWKHGFRIGVLPVVSYSGPMLADLLTGSFVVETVFRIPGLGIFFVNSSLNRDYPMVVGLVMFYAVLLLGLNLVVDVSYGLLDRRVRYE